ncbi:MAG: DUF2442 domain-containing protein [Paludibacter sp.]
MKKNLNKNIENISAKILSINSDGIYLSVGGKDYFISYNRVPWFQNAKVCEVMNVSMMGRMGIRWEDLDVDLEIDSLTNPEKYPLVIKRFANEIL